MYLLGMPGFSYREKRKRRCFTCAQGTEVTVGGGAYLKIKEASDVCDLYEANHKAVIFRKMKADEQKE